MAVSSSRVLSGRPRSVSWYIGRLLSSSRRTTFSPATVPVVATRMSMARPSTVMATWPSWGRRRSTMFMPASTFSRLTIAPPMLPGSATTSCSTPSMRNRTRTVSPIGSTWTSDARSRSAWASSRLTTCTTGAASELISRC